MGDLAPFPPFPSVPLNGVGCREARANTRPSAATALLAPCMTGNWQDLTPAPSRLGLGSRRPNFVPRVSSDDADQICGTTSYRVACEYDLPMTEAAERFLRTFKALPKPDQHDVLVSLLRLPLEADYLAPSDDELTHAAEQIFLALDQAEQAQ